MPLRTILGQSGSASTATVTFGPLKLTGTLTFGTGAVSSTTPVSTVGAVAWQGDQYFRSGRPWVDVRAYGAAGDGVTDDGAAIASAISAINTLGGGTLFFPPGTYFVNSNVVTSAGSFGHCGIYLGNSTSNVRLLGAGWASIIKAGVSVGINPFIYGTNLTGVFVEQLQIHGNKAAFAAGNGTENSQAGLILENCLQARFDTLYIHDCVTNGISLISTPDAVVRDCTIENCGNSVATPSATGISVQGGGANPSGTSDVYAVRIIGNRTKGHELLGIKIQYEATANGSLYDWTVAHNLIESNTQDGLQVGDGAVSGLATQNQIIQRGTVIGNVSQGNGRYGMLFYGATAANGGGFLSQTQRIVVIGNVVNDNTSDGIRLASSAGAFVDDLTIADNEIAHNGGWGLNTTGNRVRHPNVNHNHFLSNTSGSITDASLGPIIGVNFTGNDGSYDVGANAGTLLNLGIASLATNATQGFPAIPTMAGAPTGVPTANTGYAPLVWDDTNKQFDVYSPGAAAWTKFAIPTVTLKTGSGGGDYTTSSASYVDVDGTNLAYTVTVPTGWKALVTGIAEMYQSTAANQLWLAVTDGTTTLREVEITDLIGTSATAVAVAQTVFTGDGASHTFKLRFRTGNAADAANITNGSSTHCPTLTVLLTPSN